MSNTPKFEWNESLVRELVGIAHKDGYTSIQETDLDKLVEKFKQSKQPPLSKDKERIEVSHFAMHDNLEGNGSDSFWYQFCTSKYLMSKGYKNIEQAIEAALNEDTVVGGIEEAGIAAVKISEQLNPKLTSREQAIFIAGFQECIKWQKPKTDTVVEDSEWIKIETKGKKFIQICFDNAITGTCFDDTVGGLKETLMKSMQITYTQSEVDAIREETFLASRRLNGAKKCSCYDMKFPYYTDYLNSLNPDNKAYTKEDIERWSNSTGNRWADKKDMESQPQPRTEKSDTGKDSKEWEILTWLSPTGEVATLISGGIECNLKAGYTIRSVRRLSDNTVFSVGDEVYVTCSDGKGFRDTINHFTFTGGVDIIDVYFKDQLHTTFGIHWLNIAKPAPTQTVTDNSDVACLSITDIKEVMPKYTYELFKKDFENKLNQKLKTHTP